MLCGHLCEHACFCSFELLPLHCFFASSLLFDQSVGLSPCLSTLATGGLGQTEASPGVGTQGTSSVVSDGKVPKHRIELVFHLYPLERLISGHFI